ncbi:hypothetical protein D1614_19590 [Maribellus luteus]|uniref:Uncharacterized protein n=1 Tax=Maribellus luteus TaxID=2305463 RepID=A0A399SW37_9BACT|nr:hypothetical protein [Maribellus luteus]RIJ46177.1 hypothetical protein D1614_19590 [Maribellus luteus]
MEKTLDLNLLGVVELDSEELKDANGGWIRLVYAHLAALAAELVYEGVEQCYNDFVEGFEETYNH